MILRDIKDEFIRISGLFGATFTNKSFPELQEFVQTHDFATPLINLIPVDSIQQNIMESSAVRYDLTFNLYFLTKFQKSNTLEDDKDDVQIDTMLALSEAFYRELHKNEALLFITPLFRWRNKITRQFTSNLLAGCNTEINLDTSCAIIPSPVPSPPVAPPANFDELVALIGRGSNYPQVTGQITSFRTGDDPDIEATIFAPVRAANSLKAINSLASFLVLNNNNSFGNLNRFTDTAGGQDYDGTGGSLIDYVIDNYTGLAWHRIFFNDTWNDGIDNALASTQSGFSDWFVPNTAQFYSLFNNSINVQLFYQPFQLATFAESLTSTTRPAVTDQFMSVKSISRIDLETKITARNYFLCRKHF